MKPNTSRIFVILFLLAQIQPLMAQPEIEKDTEQINLGTRFTYYSKILDESRTVNLYLPEYYHESSEDHTYPVIYLNGSHGDRFFQTTAGIVRHMSYVERMPEAIVVSFHDGISYAPTVYNNDMWGTQEKLDFETDPDLFIRHLEEEFFPMLEANYRVADYRIIVGVSGSAFFPLHTFVNAPEMFDAHFILASADIIGMGYEKGKTFVDAMEQTFIQIPNRKEILYFGVAEHDIAWKEHYKVNMTNLREKILPFASDSFKIDIDVIEGEMHYDSYLKALLAGIELTFPHKKWSPKYRDIVKRDGEAMANIDAFYDSLSSDYGFRILPKANRWNNVNCLRFIGSRFLIDDAPEEALEVLTRWTAYRPRSAEAMSALAFGYKANDQIDMAISTQKKAIELAKKYDTESVAYYEEKLTDLTKSGE